MAILPGQDGSATWGTDGIGTGETVETHPFLSQSVNGRRLRVVLEVGAIGRDSFKGMIIHENNYHVWSYGLGGTAAQDAEKQNGRKVFHERVLPCAPGTPGDKPALQT